jgi:hypothetical protein
MNGRIIEGDDPAHSEFLRRFELAGVPKGARKVRISFEGKAQSNNKESYSYVAIDTLDACIADPQDKEQAGCGGTAKAMRKPAQNNCKTPTMKDKQ